MIDLRYHSSCYCEYKTKLYVRRVSTLLAEYTTSTLAVSNVGDSAWMFINMFTVEAILINMNIEFLIHTTFSKMWKYLDAPVSLGVSSFDNFMFSSNIHRQLSR